MVVARYRWLAPPQVSVTPECRAIGLAAGLSERTLRLLAARGVATADALRRFLAEPVDGLHDPRLLPDADVALARIGRARERGERVLVFGDFDADGLTGLAILVLALRRLGLDAAPYVPERIGDGHGLSMRAVEQAEAQGRTLIVTADCGTSSETEIAAARERGLDVVVTDHHHAPQWPQSAVAVVNPQRADSGYPDRDLTGAGVAWKAAQLLLGRGGEALSPEARDLADLAIVGTVADVAPILGENRAIARLGLDRLRRDPRPGFAALMASAGIARDRIRIDDIAFALAPRLNAAGRVGEAARAERLLLAEDAASAEELAREIEAANAERRELTRTVLDEARAALGLAGAAAGRAGASTSIDAGASGGTLWPDEELGRTPATAPARLPAELPPALLVRGEWPVGIIGLVAGKLAEDTGRPAVVVAPIDAEAGLLRGSCRGPAGWSLVEALERCEDLLARHGGHAAAAGFDIEAGRWSEFAGRFLELAGAAPRHEATPEIALDMILPAGELDYELVRELETLEPTGVGNLAPTLCLTGLRVVRARSANGGHTQLVLGRARDVLDAIAFRRPDLAASLREGDRIDVVARAASRSFGGFESIQLEVLDVADEGSGPVGVSGVDAGMPAASKGSVGA
jgi:single-stranded-DNA-specific exonuclease